MASDTRPREGGIRERRKEAAPKRSYQPLGAFGGQYACLVGPYLTLARATLAASLRQTGCSQPSRFWFWAVVQRSATRACTDEVAAAALLYADGWSLAKLGQKFAVDGATVWRALKVAGVVMRPRPDHTTENNIKKLLP
jgi:hypothetical protein